MRVASLAVVFTLLGAIGAPAFGAPCVVACKDEVAACRTSECNGLTGKPRRQCRHACKSGLMKDCFLDLSVCGATTARPVRPGTTGGGMVGGGGGGW